MNEKNIKCIKCGKVLDKPYERLILQINKKWEYFCEDHFKIEEQKLTSLELIKKIYNKVNSLCWLNLDVWIEILEERFENE